jgi:hypothetical protein
MTMFMPGDNRAKNAYNSWANRMGDFADDGTMLPRWEELSVRVRLCWEGMIDQVWTEASHATAVMNAGVTGPAASAAMGVTGPAASATMGLTGPSASAA